VGKVFTEIGPALAEWVRAQRLFFVATAPLAREGLVNCSPKGMDSFRILGPRKVGYLDLTGSGIETMAHLRENGRVVFMFCAFEGSPRIVRFHGSGSYHAAGSDEFRQLRPLFASHPGIRGIVVADLNRIGDSCGFGVPLYQFVEERDTLQRWAEKKGPEGVVAYQREKNAVSLDGLPALAAPAD
jgi:hypothetical protein